MFRLAIMSMKGSHCKKKLQGNTIANLQKEMKENSSEIT